MPDILTYFEMEGISQRKNMEHNQLINYREKNDQKAFCESSFQCMSCITLSN